MARSCGEPEEALEEEEENSDEEGDDDGELSFEEKETEKQHLLYCQERSVCKTDKSFKIKRFLEHEFISGLHY